MVVDDFGDAVGYERRCQSCEAWRPLTRAYYWRPSVHTTGSWAYRCLACAVKTRKRMPKLSETNRIARESREERREREELERMDAVLARMAAGENVEPMRRRMEYGPEFPARLVLERVVYPIVRRELREYDVRPADDSDDAIAAAVREFGSRLAGVKAHNGEGAVGVWARVAERLGVAEGVLRAWRREPGRAVRGSTLERVLLDAGLLWWEVFAPEDGRVYEEARRWLGDG